MFKCTENTQLQVTTTVSTFKFSNYNKTLRRVNTSISI